jgi:hypothetical protein
MFRFRCEFAQDRCEQVDPDPVHISEEHVARCHFALEPLIPGALSSGSTRLEEEA